MNFIIEQWCGWAPGLEDEQAWQKWALHPTCMPENDAQPDCDFLPAMQRRRLSRLARMTLHVAWPLCGEHEQLPFVFASRHGETQRTYALLSEVAAQQPLSPTQFGLSVHNAIAGQWSILRGQHGESVALAGEGDIFEHAMVEAAALLSEGAPSVLVVLAEEYPPTPYRDWIDDVPFSYAVALRVRAAPANTGQDAVWQLRLEPDSGEPRSATWPHVLEFVRAMYTHADKLEHACKTRRWVWQQQAVVVDIPGLGA